MIIETKLQIPRMRTNLVERPLLISQLDEGLHCKLTLITAPAGYGKSTLLSEWISSLEFSVAWLSLDSDDDHPVRFWTHVITALKQASAAFDDQSVLRYVDEGLDEETLIAGLINNLTRLPKSMVLVWDDFHHIKNPSILNGVTYLLERIPNHIHLYIASRIYPSCPLSRLRAAGNLIDIGANQLRFVANEVIHFFKYCTNISLNKYEAEAILDQTEGWVAGMRLAALSMKQSEPMAVVHKMTGRHHDFSDYFFEEVLSKQTVDIQQFILKTSILERLNSELSAAVTGNPNSFQLLQQLELSNLFLVSLDEQRGWFRYHHLFQDFLRMQLEILQPEAINDLHDKAGCWLEGNGYNEEALDQYLAGGKYTAAIHLLQKLIPTMQNYERVALHNWLNAIPDDLLFRKPALFLTNLAALYMSGYLDEATEKYWWAIHNLEQATHNFSVLEVQQMYAGLDFLVAFRSFLERDFESVIIYSRKYVQREPEGSLLIGFGFERDGYHPAWDIFVSDGNLHTAAKILPDLLGIWSGTRNKPFYGHLCMDYAKLLYEWNQLDRAEEYLRQSLVCGRESDNVSLKMNASLMIAQIEAVRGDMELAEVWLNQLTVEIKPQIYPMLAKKIENFQLRLRLMMGETGMMAAWCREHSLRFSDEITSVMTEEYLLLTRLMVSEGETDKALNLINRLLYIADKESKKRDLIRLFFYKGLLFARQNSMEQSFKMLEEAFALAESEGYIRTILDEGQVLEKLLTKYVDSLKKNHYHSIKKMNVTYVKQLLYSMKQERKVHMRGNFKDDFIAYDALLTAKEQTVLEFINAGLSNKAIAQEMKISLSTVKTHINNLYRKLGVNNRVLAIQQAEKLNFL